MDPATLFTGVFLWLHDIGRCDGGDIPTIIARCQQAGVAGLLIKDTDGGHGYNDWAQVKALCAALRAAGLIAVTWGYHYAQDVAAEAAATIQAVHNANPHARVFDVEQEWENQPDPAGRATRFLGLVRAALPDLPLGYSPVGAIQYHLAVPYRQFSDAGCAMLPQLYWIEYKWSPAYTVQQFYDAVDRYQLASTPIFPAYDDSPGAGEGASTNDLAIYLSAVQAKGVTGVSAWVYDFLDEAAWERVRQATAVFPAFVAPTPVPDPQVVALEAEVATLTTELQTEQAQEARLAAAIAAAQHDLSGSTQQ